jgi:hypothetical protein
MRIVAIRHPLSPFIRLTTTLPFTDPFPARHLACIDAYIQGAPAHSSRSQAGIISSQADVRSSKEGTLQVRASRLRAASQLAASRLRAKQLPANRGQAYGGGFPHRRTESHAGPVIGTAPG